MSKQQFLVYCFSFATQTPSNASLRCVSDNNLATVAASIPPAPRTTQLFLQPEVVPAKHASL